MRRKKVWRYYCDYCKKAGCSGGHLKKHEERCTLNPNRTCGFCNLLEQPQPDLKKAVELLPAPKKYIKESDEGWMEYGDLEKVVSDALPTLRDFVGDCPACIMAALRQRGIPVPMAKDFNFKKEADGIWSDFNNKRREEDERLLLDRLGE